ncbi:MAG TPA: hypothetical protein VKV26_14470 [Dehalococcoidia bacterium]|nr:hypothetical protein [Dehalococcoidia bacterium]
MRGKDTARMMLPGGGVAGLGAVLPVVPTLAIGEEIPQLGARPVPFGGRVTSSDF